MKLNRQQKMLIALAIALVVVWQLGWLNLGAQFFGSVGGNPVNEWASYPCSIDMNAKLISCGAGPWHNANPSYYSGVFAYGIRKRTDTAALSVDGGVTWVIPSEWNPRVTSIVMEKDADGNLGTADVAVVPVSFIAPNPKIPCLTIGACYETGIGVLVDIGAVSSQSQYRVKSMTVYYGSGTATTIPGTTTTIPQPGPIDIVSIINQLFDSIFNVIKNLLGWLQIA